MTSNSSITTAALCLLPREEPCSLQQLPKQNAVSVHIDFDGDIGFYHFLGTSAHQVVNKEFWGQVLHRAKHKCSVIWWWGWHSLSVATSCHGCDCRRQPWYTFSFSHVAVSTTGPRSMFGSALLANLKT